MHTLINQKDISPGDTADFIAELNQHNEYRIGFCGTDAEEILDSMEEDNSEMVAAVESGTMIGFIGIDADDDSAEVWEPFVDSVGLLTVCPIQFRH
ncbi:hypothetical protein [Lentibacillus amyloliquefaciens]|uniref:N-acetyltransferase domain-containing protein n=1 Tax=Lentibacillus amyloliquefaciens TaxID=1472767 RepID=A0A0U4FFA2_9BACI|nr:hypothetical protein [Lentibacillus amyloliquefaciens]ALX49213.1 hypothetical protein AOX59_11830 [Lentibacillus amyloliquefaciens]